MSTGAAWERGREATTAQRERWLWGGASHPGGRSEQQDRWGVFITPDRQGLLAVVADGLGGHQDGALGAQATIDAASRFSQEQADMLRRRPAEALTLLCAQSHANIIALSPSAHSTIVALWLLGDQAHWMHVGDSRLYHLRAGRRLLRTRDHSAAQVLFELGEISEAELADHPDQGRLYRSLGMEEAPRPALGAGRVQANDVFALCSDGLWQHIGERELWKVTAGSVELTTAAQQLVDQAAARGGLEADNATLVLARPVRGKTYGWDWLWRAVRMQ